MRRAASRARLGAGFPCGACEAVLDAHVHDGAAARARRTARDRRTVALVAPRPELVSKAPCTLLRRSTRTLDPDGPAAGGALAHCPNLDDDAMFCTVPVSAMRPDGQRTPTGGRREVRSP
jgi:hypothetical protein